MLQVIFYNLLQFKFTSIPELTSTVVNRNVLYRYIVVKQIAPAQLVI